MLSLPILMKGFICVGVGVPAASASADAPGTAKPMTKPPPTSAPAFRNARRLSFGIVFMPAPPCACRARRDESPRGRGCTCRSGKCCRPSPASMSASVGRLVLGEQRDRRHDLARLAIAALRHLDGDPRPLHRVTVVGRQALDRRHFLSDRRGDRRRARAHGRAVEVDRACAAQRHPAAVFRAGKTDVIAQYPKQRRIGRGVDGVRLAVHKELGHRFLR